MKEITRLAAVAGGASLYGVLNSIAWLTAFRILPYSSCLAETSQALGVALCVWCASWLMAPPDGIEANRNALRMSAYLYGLSGLVPVVAAYAGRWVHWTLILAAVVLLIQCGCAAARLDVLRRSLVPHSAGCR